METISKSHYIVTSVSVTMDYFYYCVNGDLLTKQQGR